jgi:hypothetical protein
VVNVVKRTIPPSDKSAHTSSFLDKRFVLRPGTRSPPWSHSSTCSTNMQDADDPSLPSVVVVVVVVLQLYPLSPFRVLT